MTSKLVETMNHDKQCIAEESDEEFSKINKDTTPRDWIASRIEHWMIPCLLGSPLRFTDSILGDHMNDPVSAICLVWHQSHRWLRVLISDHDVQIVTSDIHLITVLPHDSIEIPFITWMKLQNFLPQ